MLLGILAIIRLIVSEVNDIGVLKMVIIISMFVIAALALIAGILYATLFSLGRVAAGMIFCFLLTAACVGLAIFTFTEE